MNATRARFGAMVAAAICTGCSTGSTSLVPAASRVGLGRLRRSPKGIFIVASITQQMALNGDVPYQLGGTKTIHDLLRERRLDAVCPTPQWYAEQRGSISIYQNWFGNYVLPDGSIWMHTDVVYLGTSNIVAGYVYTGQSAVNPNGSLWFAPVSAAAYPETIQAYNANLSALQAQVSYDDLPGDGSGTVATRFGIPNADDPGASGIAGSC